LFSYLRPKKKQEYLPQLIEIQGGFVCLYCKEALGANDWIYEHLDGDRQHNDLGNIRLAHQKCNIKKINSPEYQIIAKNELEKESEKCLKERKNYDDNSLEHYSSEIEINVKCRNYTKRFLEEHIATDDSILYNDALWGIVNDLNEKYDHGSEQAVRRYLNALCSITGKFMINKNDEGKREIVKRMGN